MKMNPAPDYEKTKPILKPVLSVVEWAKIKILRHLLTEFEQRRLCNGEIIQKFLLD
jgi:hypothetical protein